MLNNNCWEVACQYSKVPSTWVAINAFLIFVELGLRAKHDTGEWSIFLKTYWTFPFIYWKSTFGTWHHSDCSITTSQSHEHVLCEVLCRVNLRLGISSELCSKMVLQLYRIRDWSQISSLFTSVCLSSYVGRKVLLLHFRYYWCFLYLIKAFIQRNNLILIAISMIWYLSYTF